MSCGDWNDGWVGALYGELDEGERTAMERHLADCPECRERRNELEETRRLLLASAPVIPQAPPIRFEAPRGLRRPVLAFLAGAAAAAAVFSVGVFVGLQRTAPAATATPATSEIARTGPSTDELLARIDRLEARLAESATPTESFVTPDQLDDRLNRFERSLQVARARDMEFVLGEIQATEWRAGNWVDETRDALRMVALQADRRISQR